eukprot:GDKJ01050263.1.p1 GENE.GDKJ01050263.1~~GDKJ01050263.1.p1  ORF type:complete len:496 (-),score=26.73 GDKJ01050263.1:233-1657(-)
MTFQSQLPRVDSGDMQLLVKSGGMTYLALDSDTPTAVAQQPSGFTHDKQVANERRFATLRSNRSPIHASLLKLALQPSPTKVKNPRQYLNDYTENESHFKNNGSRLSDPLAGDILDRETMIMVEGEDESDKTPPVAEERPTLAVQDTKAIPMGPLQESVLATRRSQCHPKMPSPKAKAKAKARVASPTVVKRLKAIINTIEDSLLRNAAKRPQEGSPNARVNQPLDAQGRSRYVACPSEVVIIPQPTQFTKEVHQRSHPAVVYQSVGKEQNGKNGIAAKCYVPVLARFDYNSRKVPIKATHANAITDEVPKSDAGASAPPQPPSPILSTIRDFIKSATDKIFSSRAPEDHTVEPQISEALEIDEAHQEPSKGIKVFATEPILMVKKEPARSTLMSSAKQGFGVRKTLAGNASNPNCLQSYRFPPQPTNALPPSSPNEGKDILIGHTDMKKSFRDQRRNGIVGDEALAEAFRANF